jgi:tetratricopeptide (TPR) repeat protein
MKIAKSSLPRLISLLLLFVTANSAFAQIFLPKINNVSAIQKDTSNFYFKEIWIQSKDVNTDDAYGYTRRASEKIQLGYYDKAIADIDKSISLDSTISYNYTLKGICKLKEDSDLIALEYINKAKAINDTDATNYFYLGEIYLGLNRLAEADSFYYISTVIDWKSYNAYFGRANVSFMRGHIKESEKLYKKVLELKPDFAMAYFNLAILYLSDDEGKAFRYLNKTIDASPNFAHAYYFRGYLKLFQNTSAVPTLKDWNKAISIDSTNTLYRLSRGFLYIYDERYDEGIDELNLAVNYSNTKNYTSDFEKSPDAQRTNDFFTQLITFNQYVESLSIDEKEQLKKALGLFYKKDFTEADAIYTKLLKKCPSKGLIYYLKGYNQEYLKNSAIALENYQNALIQTKFPFETYLRQGSVYIDLHKFSDAIKSLNIYINKYDSIKFAYRCRGIAYVQLQQFDSALMDFDKFLKLDSTESDIYFNRAVCYKAMGNYPKAIDNFDYVLVHHDKFDMESVVMSSECKYMSGDTLGALRLLCQTHDSVNWLSDEGYYLRGLIYFSYEKFDSAIHDFSLYIRFNTKNPVAFIFRGKAYYNKLDYNNALMDFYTAINLDGNNINALYARGLVYTRLNKPDLAYKDFKLAESLGHPYAKQAIKIFLKNYNANEVKTE